MATQGQKAESVGGHHRMPPGLSGFPFSLRWRLTLVLSAGILLATTLCVLASVAFLQRALTDRATSDLRVTLSDASAYLDLQQNRLVKIAELLSADPQIKSSPGKRWGLTYRLTPYYTGLDLDMLKVIDSKGRVVWNMDGPTTSRRSAVKRVGVYQALAGHEWVGVDREPGPPPGSAGWAIEAAAPVTLGSGDTQVVVVGRRLDSAFAAELGHQLGAGINLVVDGRRTGSTETDREGLPIVGHVEPASVLARVAAGRTSIAKINEGGHAVLSGLVPLNDLSGRWSAGVEVVRPLDPLYNVISKLSLLLIAIGFAIVIGGALLALYFGRRLTRRLLTLETVTSEVVKHAAADGPFRDFPHTLPTQGKDEVASLARSFDAMMTALDDRMASNAQLYEAAQARVNELTKLEEVARLLTAGQPLEETLDTLSAQVCRLVGCRAAGIYVHADQETATLFGGYGLPEGYGALISSAMDIPAGEDTPLASQAAYWSGRPSWRLVDRQGDRFTKVLNAADTQGWGAATAVPLRLQDRTIGVLTCYTADPHPLSDSQMSLLTTVAGQVAVAVENARLYAQARDTAAVTERARLARELHDSVTQALFSMTMHTRVAEVVLERDGMDARDRLAQVVGQLSQLTRGALAEMRALIFELRPNALREEGLDAALQKHCAAVSAREGLQVDVSVPESRIPLDPHIEEHLYRLGQEALHNAVKHAQATQVQVRLWADSSGVMLEINDDGVGFVPDAVPPGHLGMRTMADRVDQMGGVMTVRSAPGQGTTIRAEIPHVDALRRTS